MVATLYNWLKVFLATEEGTSSPRVSAMITRLFIFSRVELAFLILIVFDMVLKPFQ